jgi:hypothetical protein
MVVLLLTIPLLFIHNNTLNNVRPQRRYVRFPLQSHHHMSPSRGNCLRINVTTKIRGSARPTRSQLEHVLNTFNLVFHGPSRSSPHSSAVPESPAIITRQHETLLRRSSLRTFTPIHAPSIDALVLAVGGCGTVRCVDRAAFHPSPSTSPCLSAFLVVELLHHSVTFRTHDRPPTDAVFLSLFS